MRIRPFRRRQARQVNKLRSNRPARFPVFFSVRFRPDEFLRRASICVITECVLVGAEWSPDRFSGQGSSVRDAANSLPALSYTVLSTGHGVAPALPCTIMMFLAHRNGQSDVSQNLLDWPFHPAERERRTLDRVRCRGRGRHSRRVGR